MSDDGAGTDMRYRALDHGAPWGRRAEAQVDTSKVEVQRRDEVANA